MADTIIELYGWMELQRMLNRFFNSAMYYGVLGATRAEVKTEVRAASSKMQIAHRSGGK